MAPHVELLPGLLTCLQYIMLHEFIILVLDLVNWLLALFCARKVICIQVVHYKTMEHIFAKQFAYAEASMG